MNTFLRTSGMQSCLAATCLIAVNATEVSADNRDTARKLSGTITKMDTRRVSIATSWGHMNIQSAALNDSKVGDEVTVWVNESNAVVDAYPEGRARPADHQVHGRLSAASSGKSTIKIRTLEGEKEFGVKQNLSKFTMFKEGTPITVHLNITGDIIDVQRQSDLLPVPAPVPHPGFRIKLDGVVARIKSGQVFVKTPRAEYSLNAKSVLQDVKVGDELTIWLSDNNVAVDHHAKGKGGAHRYIMGQLAAASVDLKEVTLMTLSGTRSFTVAHGESKLYGMKQGTSLIVELNEVDHVIEIRKVG